jgi:hypothetical protein
MMAANKLDSCSDDGPQQVHCNGVAGFVDCNAMFEGTATDPAITNRISRSHLARFPEQKRITTGPLPKGSLPLSDSYFHCFRVAVKNQIGSRQADRAQIVITRIAVQLQFALSLGKPLSNFHASANVG